MSEYMHFQSVPDDVFAMCDMKACPVHLYLGFTWYLLSWGRCYSNLYKYLDRAGSHLDITQVLDTGLLINEMVTRKHTYRSWMSSFQNLCKMRLFAQ